MSDKMNLMSAEFNAAHELSDAFRALPAVVDDDYPEARRRYEGALRTFLLAARANGRIGPGVPVFGETSSRKEEEVTDTRAWRKDESTLSGVCERLEAIRDLLEPIASAVVRREVGSINVDVILPEKVKARVDEGSWRTKPSDAEGSVQTVHDGLVPIAWLRQLNEAARALSEASRALGSSPNRRMESRNAERSANEIRQFIERRTK